ncbi:MAG: SRPBCC family protein [Candidatus Limnocylindrales bacterium]
MRVELQSEVDAPREAVFALVSTTDGLRRWLDEAEIEPREGGAVRLRLRDARVIGRILAFDPQQHVSFIWDYPDEPLGVPSVVAFDAIEHGQRTHLTVRHVGFPDPRQRDAHEALWRFWFPRLVRAAAGRVQVEAATEGGIRS